MEKKKLLNVYFLLLFIYNAASCELVTVADWAPWYLSCIPLVLSFIVAQKCRVNLFHKRILILILILTLWNAAQYFVNHVTPSPYALILMVVAWVAYNVYHEDFADRFIKITIALSSISLVVWLLCVIFPEGMRELGMLYGIETMDVSYSFIFFNIGKAFNYRNYGFCWEPGRYSCILLIALYFYYIKNGFKNRTKGFYILIISLVTTMSTTGIAAFLIFLAYVLYKKKGLNPIYWVPLVLLFLFVWTLPFMGEKIREFGIGEEKYLSAIDIQEWNSRNGIADGYYCPQRFEGMMFQLMNVAHMNPIIGEGHNFTNFYINKELGYRIAASEGILFHVLCYGLIIGLLSYYYLFRASKYWSEKYRSNVPGLFFFVFLVTNFSYDFWEFPLYMVTWLWAYFEGGKSIRLNA